MEAWTCPFCSLLCEGFAHPADASATCARARSRVATLEESGARASPSEALAPTIARAAARLASWRQPLFGGLGTDVSGARALYRLAARCGAICDHADGDAAMHGLRALQDRGQYTATLGEVRTRAHTIVCIGTDGVARYPRLFDRLGLDRTDSPCRKLVFLGARGAAPSTTTTTTTTAATTTSTTATTPSTTVPIVHLPGSGDLHADVQQLAAWVARKPNARPANADPALAALADELLASSYTVLVWEGAALPPQGALIVELLDRIVATLNQTTRAATLGLGGSDGAASVNQAFTWLSGLPLRTRVAHDGLVHDPHRFATSRLLADGAVDGMLWIHGFDATRTPPASGLPRIVLGPPAMAARSGADDIFIPVAVPGLHTGAHLFRTDGSVMLKLDAATMAPTTAPTPMSVAQTVAALHQALDAIAASTTGAAA